jgi:hypothetical protein
MKVNGLMMENVTVRRQGTFNLDLFSIILTHKLNSRRKRETFSNADKKEKKMDA